MKHLPHAYLKTRKDKVNLDFYSPAANQRIFMPGKELITGFFVLGWIFLTLQFLEVVQQGPVSEYGIGMGLLEPLRLFLYDIIGLQPWALQLCVYGEAAWSAQDFTASFFMWCAMILAMMLPKTFMIFKTRENKNLTIVQTLYFLCGFAVYGIIFSCLATMLQWILHTNELMNQQMMMVGIWLPLATLAFAGLLKISDYRFSSKHLVSTQIADVNLTAFVPNQLYKLGLKFGLETIIQSIPYMLIMFVLGLMNILAMILLTLVMCFENRKEQVIN